MKIFTIVKIRFIEYYFLRFIIKKQAWLMIKQAVLDKLSALTEIEKEKPETSQFGNDLSHYTLIKTVDKRVVNKRLLSHHSIYLSKHNRFAPYPLHSHQFVEINYMLKGECDELVEDEPIHLKEGNVLMMDIGCHHSISTLHQNDLMINLIFNNKNISFKFWDETHKKDSFIYQYIFADCKIKLNTLEK
ncbi:AraC family transcriptional regulator [Lactobacillus amylovorus DSM 20531]|nr:AraC family transcriptional regulator [Lactobacillus amylovorus DSM 20531]